MEPKRLQTYETDEIVVTFDPNLCIHSGVCVRGLPAVFDVKRKRWVRPDLATAEAGGGANRPVSVRGAAVPNESPTGGLTAKALEALEALKALTGRSLISSSAPLAPSAPTAPAQL